ncbi:MAG: ATP-dependent DNA ligase [Candidatus Micrarchaeia archaeon]
MLFSELVSYYEKLDKVSSRLAMIDILAEVFKKAESNEIMHIVYMTQGVLAPPFEGIEFGMAEKMVEEAIAISTGFTKEEVDKAYKKAGDLGIVAQDFIGKTKLKRMNEKKYMVNDIYETMFKISRISGSGSKELKIRLLSSLINSSNPTEAKYIVKYPLNELRLGVGDATILEALSIMVADNRTLKDKLEHAYNICSDLGMVAEKLKLEGMNAVENFKVTIFKPIRPALAERLPTAEEILEKMNGKCSVDQKYDGFRCQIHKKGNEVKIYSRRLENTTNMYPDLVEAAKKELKVESIILEGEALAYNEATNEFLPFQETIQRKRKYGINEKIAELPLKLFAFDLMYINGKDIMNEPYKERRERLENILKNTKTIIPAKRIVTDNAKELNEFFEDSIANGLEGIVAKDLNAPYIAGARKFAWIKMKRSYKGELSDTVDLVIVGYYLGRGIRSEFKFGGLLCAVYNEKRDMFETVSRIGSGFTEIQMKELEEKLDKIKVSKKPPRVDSVVEPDFWVYPKYIITVKADEITKSPTHTCGKEKQIDGTEVGYALRFPRLVGEESAIRSDKSIEDATTTKEIIEMYKMQKRISMHTEEK